MTLLKGFDTIYTRQGSTTKVLHCQECFLRQNQMNILTANVRITAIVCIFELLFIQFLNYKYTYIEMVIEITF